MSDGTKNLKFIFYDSLEKELLPDRASKLPKKNCFIFNFSFLSKILHSNKKKKKKRIVILMKMKMNYNTDCILHNEQLIVVVFFVYNN